MAPTPNSDRDARFGRQLGVLGRDLHDALAGAAIFMPGLGAIGSATLSAIARTGIGRLVLIDDVEAIPWLIPCARKPDQRNTRPGPGVAWVRRPTSSHGGRTDWAKQAKRAVVRAGSAAGRPQG